jgi:2-hydroxy-6-oxonona-2,4-dienedioate hydrolase
MTVFKSDAARERLQAYYPKFQARIPTPTERVTVPTRYGDTNVLVGGEGPPLVIVHGSLSSSAHAVSEVAALLKTRRVIAPDIPGQSIVGAEVRPPFDGFGGWLADVLDGMGLTTVDILGVSYGGFVTMRLLALAPARARRVVLLVPAGMAGGGTIPGLRTAMAYACYRMAPSPARLTTFIRQIVTTLDDELWNASFGAALDGFILDFRIPPLSTVAELAAFTGPTLVIGAEHDGSFDGAAVVARAAQLFAGHVQTSLIAGSKHCPPFNDAFRASLVAQVSTFLDAA